MADETPTPETTETPKKTSKKTTNQTDPQPWDGSANTEKFCALCQGFVNGNGCAREVCPVRPK